MLVKLIWGALKRVMCLRDLILQACLVNFAAWSDGRYIGFYFKINFAHCYRTELVRYKIHVHIERRSVYEGISLSVSYES